MTRPSFVRLVAALLTLLSSMALALPLAQLPADAVIVEGEAMPASVLKRARAAAEAVVANADDASSSASLAKLSQLVDPVEQEFAAASVIAALQGGADTPARRALLTALASAPVRVFKRHDETRADWFVPLFNVAARARFALALLDARARRQAWVNDFAADPQGALDSLESASPVESRAAVEAVDELSAKQLDSLAQLMLKRTKSLPSALWRSIALRSAAPAAFDAALSACSDTDLIALVPAAAASQPESAATAWLMVASRRPAVSSAALLALAPLAEPGSPALGALLDALDDPTMGASAAASLAQRPLSDRESLLIALADDAGSASTARLTSLALALRLVDSRSSRLALRKLAENPRLPPSLRAEITR